MCTNIKPVTKKDILFDLYHSCLQSLRSFMYKLKPTTASSSFFGLVVANRLGNQMTGVRIPIGRIIFFFSVYYCDDKAFKLASVKMNICNELVKSQQLWEQGYIIVWSCRLRLGLGLGAFRFGSFS